MKLQNRVAFTFFLILSSTHIYSAQAAKNAALRARNLILLIDPRAHEVPDSASTALTRVLVSALTLKSTPIILTPSLWYSFVERRQRLASKLSKTPFHSNAETIKKILDTIIEQDGTMYIDDFMCYAAPFDPQEWIIKIIPLVAIILIPKKYIDSITLHAEDFINNIPLKNKQETIFKRYKSSTTLAGNLTPRELLLGLKIDLWQDMIDPLAINPLLPMEIKNQFPLEAIKRFDWTELFVTRRDLDLQAPTNKPNPPIKPFKKKSTAQIRKEHEKYLLQVREQQAIKDPLEFYLWPWQIYMVGHGTAAYNDKEQEAIAALPVKNFLNFVNFLNFSIKTEFFFYLSCYAGGKHTDPTFQYTHEIKTKKLFKKIPYNLNFTIGVGSITDQIAYSTLPLFGARARSTQGLDILIDNVPVALRRYLDFPAFFYELDKFFTHQADKKSLPDIIEIIHKFKNVDDNLKPIPDGPLIYFPELEGSPDLMNNIPLIRLPNTEWFKATDLQETVDTIDKKIIMKYFATKTTPIEITQDVLLIYEPYVPTLTIFNNDKTKIIPMNTQTHTYLFETIKKSGPDLASIFKAFVPFRRVHIPISFYIRKLEITIGSHNGIEGELGDIYYTNKQVVLNNVTINQTETNITISFIFQGRLASHYYDIALPSNTYQKEFNNRIKPRNIDQQNYIQGFNTKTESLKEKFEQFAREIRTVEKVQQEKVKQGPQPPSDLMFALQRLASSLTDLTSTFNY